MSDPQDRILEVFLEQLLNERKRPDCAADVLHKLDRVSQSKQDKALPKSLPSAALPPTSPASGEPQVTAAKPARKQRNSQSHRGRHSPARWIKWISHGSVAAAILIAAGLTWWLLSAGGEREIEPTADRNDRPLFDPIPTFTQRDSTAADVRPDRVVVRDRPQSVVADETAQSQIANEHLATRDDIPADQTKLVFPGEFVRSERPAVAALSPLAAAALINQTLQQVWQQRALQPTNQIDDGAWINRLSNRVIGRTPNATDMARLQPIVESAPDSVPRRVQLVEMLSGNDLYRDEFLDHWSRVIAWRLLGLSSAIGAEVVNDRDMNRTHQFLRQRLGDGVPLDQLIYELISAVGTTDPSRPDFNPAASFIIGLNKRFGTRELSSSHLSQALVGLQTRCVQCHDGTADTVATQNSFWEFHAFFAQMRIERSGSDNYFVVNRNYLPYGSEGKVDAPLIYQDSAGAPQRVYPALFENRLGSNGFVAKVDRRTELAKLIANSQQWRETITNQVWTRLLNVPLTGIDPHADPAHIRLLDELNRDLATQFAANDLQLTWLVKAIALSDAFALDSGDVNQVAADNPFLGQPPAFSRFYHGYLSERPAAQSLAIVAGAYDSGKSDEAANAGLLARVDGNMVVQPQDVIQPFLPNTNNQWATSESISKQLDLIADSKLDDRQKIDHLAMAALGRTAQQREIEQAQIILRRAKDRRRALQDIWWCFVNSIEYELPLNVH